MKKTLRTIISALLIAIIALSSAASAFATAIPETINWAATYEELGEYYRAFYYGNKSLSEGKTEIRNTEDYDDLVYFDFVAEEGYYFIDTKRDSWVMIPESFDGTNAIGYIESTTIGEEEERVFFLEAGERVIGINFYCMTKDEITIEYLGKEVTDFTVEEDALKDYIINYDIGNWGLEDGVIPYFYTETDSDITFSSGKILNAEDICISGKCNGKIKSGKNTATLEFFGKEKEVEFTAYYVEELIETAELSNVENYLTTKVDYQDWVYYIEVPNEILTVYFTDGTSTTVKIIDNYGTVTLPSGREIDAWVGLDTDERDNLILDIEIAYHTVNSYDVETEEFTFAENVAELNRNNKSALEWAAREFRRAIESISTDPEYAADSFIWAVQDFFQVFRNMLDFAKCYLSIF